MPQLITFTCATNRNKAKNRWNQNNKGNTTIGDGYVRDTAQFGARVKDESIIREYLRGYQFNANEDGSYGGDIMWMRIFSRPGDNDYDKAFKVSLSSNGKWAHVDLAK